MMFSLTLRYMMKRMRVEAWPTARVKQRRLAWNIMHYVHNLYLRAMSITLAYRAPSLPMFKALSANINAVPPASPCLLKDVVQALLHFWRVTSCDRAGHPSLPCWMLACWLVIDRLDCLLASQPFFSSFTFISSFTFGPSPAPAPFFLALPFFLPLRSRFFSPPIPAFQTSAYFTKNPSNSSACTTVLILILSFFFSFDLPFVARISTGRGCGG